MSLKYYVKVITVAQYVTPHNKLGKLYATVSWLIHAKLCHLLYLQYSTSSILTRDSPVHLMTSFDT